MIQVWTINILIMPSRGWTEKSNNWQKHHRTKAPKDQHQGRQNPQKWENILRLQQSGCTIPWSHDTGVDNQHSRHAITWPDREKQKWTKAPQDESPKVSASRRTKPPKLRKYFKAPAIKVYDPMITLYRCGRSTFSSWKAKIYKSITRKPQRISIGQRKAKIQVWTQQASQDESPKERISINDHMIQVWTINILIMPSRGRTEKSKNGQKHHRTKAPKDQQNNTPKTEKIF